MQVQHLFTQDDLPGWQPGLWRHRISIRFLHKNAPSGAHAIHGLVIGFLESDLPPLELRWPRSFQLEAFNGRQPYLLVMNEAALMWVGGEEVACGTTLLDVIASCLGHQNPLAQSALEEVIWRASPTAETRAQWQAMAPELAQILAGDAIDAIAALCERELLFGYQNLWDWHRCVSAMGTLGPGLFPVAMLRRGSCPSRALVRRLAGLANPVSHEYVRLAVVLKPDERRVFDYEVARLLKGILKTAGPSAADGRQHLEHRLSFALRLADRLAFLRVRADRALTLTGSVVERLAFKVGGRACYPAYRLPARPEPANAEVVDAAWLQTWAMRCSSELLKLGADADLMEFQACANDVLEAVATGEWTDHQIRCLDWRLLARGQEAEPPLALPQVAWSCTMPACDLSQSGVAIRAVSSTQELIEESESQRNCLSSNDAYIRQILAGTGRLFKISGAVRATLFLQYRGCDGWRLGEISGPENVSILHELVTDPSPAWSAIRAFIKRHECLAPYEEHPAFSLCP